MILLVGVVSFIGAAAIHSGMLSNATNDSGGNDFLANSLLRLGIVFTALWFAMPTISKPLHWLPPGIAAICLIIIGVVAVQPRMLFLVVPVLITIVSYAWIIRWFRRLR